MNRLLVVMAVGALAGCQCVTTCTKDSDCAPNRCGPEGVCVFEAAGGAGGGAAGGRAGGSAGGATGGGMTGGGTAGGGMTAGGGATGGGMTGGGMTGGGSGGGRPLCNGGCTDAWAVCIDDGAAGVCEPGVLSVTTPVRGGSYSAGTDVAVLATLLIPDGGASWPMPVSIPVRTTWGRNVRVNSGMANVVSGAPGAGPGVMTFGWDAGPQNVERPVVFTSCEVARCQPWQECVPTETGGQCENLPLTVSVTTPAADGTSTRSTAPQFVVTVVSADGGRLPDAVPLVGLGASGPVPRDSTTANTYTTTLMLVGALDGVKSYVAGWADAGVPALSATRSLTYDGTPPNVTVLVQPPVRQAFEQDPGEMDAWKKDEAALVAVTVTDTTSPIEPVTAAMVSAPGGGMVTTAPGQCTACTGPTANALTGCYCFRAELSRTPIVGARAPATVTVTGATDRLMNPAPASNQSFTVTRFKWARTLNGAAAGVQPLALGDAGVVFAATRELSSGRVVALAPSGAVLWDTSDAGIITAGPAVGASVWVGTQSGANIALTPLALGSGVPQTGRCLFGSGGAFDGDLALVRARESSMIFESPVGARAGEGLLRMGAPACQTQGIGVTTGTPLVVARTATGAEVEVFANRGGTSPLTKQTFDENWSNNSSYGFSGYGNLVSLFTGPGFVGGGGGGFAPNNGLVMYAPNAAAVAVTGLMPSKAPFASPTNDEPYSPVSVGAGHIYGGTQGGVLRRFVLTGGALTGVRDEVTGLGDISKTTPVLGKGGLVYVVNAAGELAVVDLGGTVNAAVWRYPGLVTAAANGLGQPALDAVRDATGAAQCAKGLGVLYVPSVNLGVARVTAVIVDSPGLDPLAPWPKYQRDNRNSGFADATSPAACP